MKKLSSRYLPSYDQALEALELTQEQLSDASREYVEENSTTLRSHILERIEALSAMREDSGKILEQMRKIEKVKKGVTSRTRELLLPTIHDTAA